VRVSSVSSEAGGTGESLQDGVHEQPRTGPSIVEDFPVSTNRAQKNTPCAQKPNKKSSSCDVTSVKSGGSCTKRSRARVKAVAEWNGLTSPERIIQTHETLQKKKKI